MMQGTGANWFVRFGCLMLVAALTSVTIGQTAVTEYLPPQPVEPSVNVQRQPAGDSVATAGADGWLAVASPSGAGGQMVTLVDTQTKCMVVYAVDAKGQIKLLSSRPISQDLSVQYNVTEPTPAAISRMTNR